MSAPKVKMRMPSPISCAFLVKLAEILVSKPRNDQSKTHSTIEHPFQKLADHAAEHEDENTSGTHGIEAKLNPALRFITHHFECGEIR
jgi:hypothetical protein